MAPKGSPRDMNAWRKTLYDPNIKFPGESSELTFVRGDNSPLDHIWPIWGVLDLTPNGRGETAAYPSLQYE
jgi:hypothetical protein